MLGFYIVHIQADHIQEFDEDLLDWLQATFWIPGELAGCAVAFHNPSRLCRIKYLSMIFPKERLLLEISYVLYRCQDIS